ncbi:MAG: hypothetical protein A2Z77_07930 [Chloroflexi bacterium RBG_13_51_36]|nr:MAG: hypothetical protein A2Z77_07930 [Chloroflexi bacterium RBG_13_51_36]
MKLAARTSTIVLVLLLILVPAITVSSDKEYPQFINGEPVIVVQTSENTLSLSSNTVVLTILDDSNSMEESIAKFSDYLGSHQLPEGWSITVVGGPGASEEGVLKVHDSFNDAVRKNGGPFKTGRPIQSFASSESPEIAASTIGPTNPTFAIDATGDPGSETIKYIAAQWVAPQVGPNQDEYSELLVNGWTDQGLVDPYGDYQSGYFLQSGQLYYGGQGYHIWTDTSKGYLNQFWPVEYVPGHECWYAIAGWVDGSWSVAMYDVSAGGMWSWHWEPEAVGTKLVQSIATSVFFENWNTNTNWYTGFTNPISVYKAYNGFSYPLSIHKWYNDYIVILDDEGSQQSNDIIFKIISGRLRNLGTANWNLHRILLATEFDS